MLFFLPSVYLTCHDGEPDPVTTAPPVSTTAEPEGKTTYTKQELEEIVKRERKQSDEKIQATVKQLESLKKNETLSVQEKQRLSEQIESLQNSLLTKEQLAQKEKDKLARSHREEKTQLEQDRDTWKNRYVSETIKREIIDAAATEDAFNVNQVLAILQPSTRLVEDFDDEQKPKGTFTPKVKLRDDDGTELELTAKEAVKRMKEMPDQYGNLFKNNVTPGLGLGGSAKGGAPPNFKNMTPEQYKVYRKTIGLAPTK
jgi:hypothetical protein